jgi:hypothetical protein
MNDRIEKLAEGCFEYVVGHTVDVVEFNYKKFALLLMREIAMVQITHQTTMDLKNKKMDNPARELNYSVIKHFGVGI